MISLEEALGLQGVTVTPELPQISPTTPKQVSQETKKQQVIALIFQGYNPGKIAEKLGIDRKTVYNYFSEWAKTEQANHIQIEWLQQYEIMKLSNPEEAFQALTKVMMKLVEKQAKLELNLTQNNQTNIETNVKIDVRAMLAEYDQLFKTTGTEKTVIPTDSTTQQVHTSQTHNQAGSIPIT